MSSSVTRSRVERLDRDIGELWERHADARGSAELYRPYADDPLALFRDRWASELPEYQAEAVRAVQAHPKLTIRGAHSMGKDWLFARLLLWHVLARGGLAIYSAPTDRQLAIVMREIRAVFRSDPDMPGELYSRELRIDGEPRLLAFTSNTNTDALTGWHHPRGVMFALSEGQAEAIEEAAYDAGNAVTTEPGSRFIVGGNPVRPSGRFFEIHHAATWHAIAWPAALHPNVAAGERVVPWGLSPEWPAAMVQEYGEGSPYVVARVHAEFPTSAIDALIDADWIDDAVARWEAGTLEPVALMAARAVLGVDVARFGADESVVAVLQGGRQGAILRRFETWRGADLMDTARRVHDLARRIAVAHEAPWGPVEACPAWIDEPGVGSGAIDKLHELNRKPSAHRIGIRGFNGWTRHARHSRYSNDRAEAHWRIREGLREGTLAIPEDKKLREELLAITWSLDGTGQILIESKDDLKPRLKRSPDRLDALGMGLFGLARGSGATMFRHVV